MKDRCSDSAVKERGGFQKDVVAKVQKGISRLLRLSGKDEFKEYTLLHAHIVYNNVTGCGGEKGLVADRGRLTDDALHYILFSRQSWKVSSEYDHHGSGTSDEPPRLMARGESTGTRSCTHAYSMP
ncbi:hypothetical protein EVAR_60576_1 [Eumeta japonica]|uniref:Uncharacterized protein n=1 Tax=Eumeta variegata TaxID=151549 RepID=A0A4C1YE84_EUMVA|nr:hypothetical protein EVAR_60576_1 [Eumeta japonica]